MMETMLEEKYVVDEDAALVILQEMYAKICCEDKTLRTFRRSLSFGHYIRRTLIPLLMSTKKEPVIELTMRLLVNLTLPIECLYSVDIMSRTEAGRNNITEISTMLAVTKRSFANIRAVRAIVDYLRSILEKDTRLSSEQCQNINNCLILLRNVLHIPETDSRTKNDSDCYAIQNQILWNLFSLSIDKLLIHLMSCAQRGSFGVAMVQLIALLYKDQHISTLQKLLSSWFDASLSDSSEDFESNTTPMKATSGNSSPMLTSDSSDNGGNAKITQNEETHQTPSNNFLNSDSPTNTFIDHNSGSNKCHEIAFKTARAESTGSIDFIDPGSRKDSVSSLSDARKKSSFSEHSDCGYGTQVESLDNPEMVQTTSSNEDEQPRCHQKPPLTNQKQRYNAVNNPRSAITIHDKKEWRRKKLVKRSKNSLINMKGLLHHSPSEATISNILKEFTVDFLLKCYGLLVKELHNQLLLQTEPVIHIDTSHFFWLITYFLKFTAQLELDLEHVKLVLSYDIISYLTFEGVSLCEELDLLMGQDGGDVKPSLRRIHLVVTAIKEYLQTLESFKRISHLSSDDKSYLHVLTLQISCTSGLQCMFVMLLRRFNPTVHSKQYLQDVIVTNHILLVLLDEALKYDDYQGSLKMKDHIEQFATVEVMHQYGLLLTDFQQNGEFVNDCIFTMMHHIGGDIGQVGVLFQPTILKTFSKIFETEYELCDDWSDLIDYIIHKFINTPQQSALSLPRFSLADPNLNVSTDGEDTSLRDVWSKEETETLYWYYVQSKKTADVIGCITELFGKSELRPKSRIAIIQQLLQQDIITLLEYDDLMTAEDFEYVVETAKSPFNSSCTDESGIFVRETLAERNVDEIEMLKNRIQKDKKGKALQWLQKTLMDCCYVKLALKSRLPSGESGLDNVVLEPIPFHYSLKHQSVPVVPWNAEQSVIHLYPPFMLLLHKLGFHLPADSGKIFVRIPAFWTADIIFSVVEKLGPVDRSTLKFDISEFTDSIDASNNQRIMNGHSSYGMNKRTSSIRFTPDPLPQYAPNWLDANENTTSSGGAVTLKTIHDGELMDDQNAAEGRWLSVNSELSSDPQMTAEEMTNHNHNRQESQNSCVIIVEQEVAADAPGQGYLMDSQANGKNNNGGTSRKQSLKNKHRMHELYESIDEVDESSDGQMDMLTSPGAVDLGICETASVTSDSTQIYDLYVSDEEFN